MLGWVGQEGVGSVSMDGLAPRLVPVRREAELGLLKLRWSWLVVWGKTGVDGDRRRKKIGNLIWWGDGELR